MARIQFEGASDVAAAPEPPRVPQSDYQRIPTNPRMFGAAVGQAEEQVGGELKQTADMYGEIAAQQAANNYQEQSAEILKNYTALGAQAAMEARPQVEQQLKELREQGAQGLGLLKSQITYNNEVRRTAYFQQAAIEGHYQAQSKVWADTVDRDSIGNALGTISADPLNEALATDTLGKLNSVAIRRAQRNGLLPNDPSQLTDDQRQVITSLLAGNQTELSMHRALALEGTHPNQALHLLQANPGAAGDPRYAALVMRLQHLGDKAADDAILNGIFGSSGGGASQHRQATDDAVDAALAPVIQRESGGKAFVGYTPPGQPPVDLSKAPARAGYYGFPDWKGNQGPAGISHAAGLYQIEPDTWRPIAQQLGVTDFSPESQRAVARELYRQQGLSPWGASGATKAQSASEAAEQPAGSPKKGAPDEIAGSPSAPQSTMMAAVPGQPNLEELIARIPEGLSPERYARVQSGVVQRYNRQQQATSASRTEALSQYKGGLAMLQDGRDFAYDPNTYRRLFPHQVADEMLANLEDSRAIGEQIKGVRGMSLGDILQQQAANRTVLGNSTGAGYAQASRKAAAFDKAVEVHIKALGEDPAGYVAATNPQIQASYDAMGKETPEQSAALRGQGQPNAAETYAAQLLGEQERLQVPQDGRHVLSDAQAGGMARRIIADPQHAPETLRGLQAQWGSAWPEVWRDLATVGKLPAAYQMVGGLDDEGDAALLARALGEANKQGVNKSIEELIDKGATTGISRPSQAIRLRIEGPGAETIQDYQRSMLASGASPAQMRGIIESITLLAQAKVLYHGEQPAAAADHAVESAIGKWEFLPNGGARVPRPNLDAVSEGAHQAVEGLALGQLQVPKVYGTAASPGAASADDWLRTLKVAPNWTTVGQAIRLMDNGGRFVRRGDGGFVEIPFNVKPSAAPKTDAGPLTPQGF